MKIAHKLVIDFVRNNHVEVEITKGSTNTVELDMMLLEDGKKVDAFKIGAVSLKAIWPDGGVTFADAGDMSEEGHVYYTVSDSIMNTVGKNTCILQLVGKEGGIVNSFEFYIIVKSQLFDENQYLSNNDLLGFRTYMLRAQDAARESEEVKRLLELAYGRTDDVISDLKKEKDTYEKFLEELKQRIENGEFNGRPGEPGRNGSDGIVAEGHGIIAFQIIDGDLICHYYGTEAPPVSINTAGELEFKY